MIIVAKLKLDQKQLPYWSFMLEHDGRISREVVSQTFDINDNYNKWKQYEMASNRMAKELMGAEGGRKAQYVIAQMFLQESQYDRSENKPT
jgi:hypothetical protein